MSIYDNLLFEVLELIPLDKPIPIYIGDVFRSKMAGGKHWRNCTIVKFSTNYFVYQYVNSELTNAKVSQMRITNRYWHLNSFKRGNTWHIK